MHTDYLNPAIRQLRDQQVRFAPREKKLEQVDAGREAAGRTGSRADLYLRIPLLSDHQLPARVVSRPEAHRARRPGTICGCSSRTFPTSANVPAEAAGEQVLTVEELAKQFNVSTKTISRWRRQGLVSRRFVFDGRKRVGFLQSSVERFVEQNQERVRRGAQFSQLTDEERSEIIERARRLAQAGGCPADVTKRLAAQDRPQRRDDPLHAQAVRPRASRSGRSFPTITGRCGRRPSGRSTSSTTAASRSRRWPSGSAARGPASIGSSTRCGRSGSWNCRWTTFPTTSSRGSGRRSARSGCSGPMPASELPLKKPRLPSGLPPYLASLYEVPLLTRKQEAHLFRKMNYLKYKAGQAPRASSIRPGPRAA